jgi:hypothetical protein
LQKIIFDLEAECDVADAWGMRKGLMVHLMKEALYVSCSAYGVAGVGCSFVSSDFDMA